MGCGGVACVVPPQLGQNICVADARFCGYDLVLTQKPYSEPPPASWAEYAGAPQDPYVEVGRSMRTRAGLAWVQPSGTRRRSCRSSIHSSILYRGGLEGR